MALESGFRKMFAIEVCEVSHDWIIGQVGTFHSKEGIRWTDTKRDIKVRLEGLDNRYPLICSGERIICIGVVRHFSVESMTVEFRPGASVTHVPQLAPELHWAIHHMFAGGFGGWSQAAEWLQASNQGFVIGRQVYVDWDAHVVRTCSVNHGVTVDKAPLVPSAEYAVREKIIIEAPIADLTVLHALRMPYNMICTISPPCVSWSLGGKGGGFDSPHGVALLEAIEQVFATQPIVAMFECADAIKSHHHFPVFGALMNHLGFKQVWEQLLPYHLLANHHRTRWLSIWVRCDIPAVQVNRLIRLCVPPIVSWNDDRYRFSLPQLVLQQLRLSPDQFSQYGDLHMLPPGKRARVQSTDSTLQVIRTRIPSTSEPLPTLCSSYTQQHKLDRSHLEKRGIFASILEVNNEFLFIDPVKFVALLGSVTDIAFPSDIATAFRQIGNAISVPQALVCFILALSSITSMQIPLQESIRKCWLSRIHADVTVLDVSGDHIWIRNVVQFVMSLPKPVFHVHDPNVLVNFLDTMYPVEVNNHMNFREFAAMLFRLQFHQMMEIRVEHVSAHPLPTDLVLASLHQSAEFELYLGGYHLCTVGAWDGREHQPPSPTVNHSESEAQQLDPSLVQALSLPLGIEELRFVQTIETLENLNCTTLAPGSTFVIWAERNFWAFTPFDGGDDHFQARLKTAFECLIPPTKCIVIPIHKNFRWQRAIPGFIVRSSDQAQFAQVPCVLRETIQPDGTSIFEVVPGDPTRLAGALHNGFPVAEPCNVTDGDVFVIQGSVVRAGGVNS